MFKTCLSFSVTVFGHLEKKWKFFHFSDVFPCFDPPACTGQNFFPEKYLKTSSTLVWKLLRTFLDTFRNSIFFDFFFEFLQVLISRLHWSRKVRKKSPQKKFGHFWKRFSGFWKFEFFSIFWNFSISRPSRVHWANFFTGKNTSKHVENKFEHFWERIWAFWKLKVFQFFEVFPSLDLPGCTGQVFPRKITQNKFKICLDTFRTVFGHIWNFKFLSIFFRIFPSFDPPGCTGQFFNQKNYLEACSKRFWTFLGTYLGFLKKNESFSIFLTFFQVSTLQRALDKFFSRKIPQNNFNTCLKTFRNVFGHF